MTTLALRGSGTPATTGTTWATVTNAVDGAAGTNPATYATMTNATASAVATIDVSGYDFASTIGAGDTLNSVTVNLRHFENNTGRFVSVRFQPYDGATAIGTIQTATMATAARNDSTTFPVTLAQLRSATFKVRVTITGAASTQSRVESIDYIDVTADYTPLPPAITQAAYRFYADGTETGSTALTGAAEFSDTFTYADNASLATVSSGAWLDAGGTAVWAVASNEATFKKTGTGFIQRIVLTNTNMSSADHYAQADLRFTTFTNAQAGVCIRGAVATDGSCIEAMLDGTQFRIRSRTDGVATSLVNVAHGLTAPLTARVHIEATGDNIYAEIVGTGKTLTTTTATHNTNLKCGLLGISQFDAACFVDNFQAGIIPPTVDTSGGDVNLQLRIRLQSTNAAALPSTDDFQLQWEKNASGTWNAPGPPVEQLADSYASTNYDGFVSLQPASIVISGQSFLGNGDKLTRARFWLKKVGAPPGTLTARLYAHTGTFGASSKGTGSPLATSTTSMAATALATSEQWEAFTFDETLTLTNGTPYVVVTATTVGGDASNRVDVGGDGSSPTHAGNTVSYNGTSWFSATADRIFELYTKGAITVDVYGSANLTDAAATTNRLGAGTGSFVAGKVSEDGLADDVGWTGNNYTELLYSITLKQADLAPTDTLRFRVLRNGATTGLTYTQVPTVTIGAGGPTDRTGTATGSVTLSGTASGQKDVTGTAAGALTMSGSAAGVITHDVFGTAAGTITVTGTASGIVTAAPVLGTATGTLDVTGTASGSIAAAPVFASADGTLTVSGTAVGEHGVTGSAVGGLTLAGAASGERTVAATAAGSVALSGAAAGVKQASGVAVGNITLSGAASGQKTVGATATGSLTVAGAAAGLRVASGTATGTLTLSGVASGQKTVTGIAAGSLTISGTATAIKQVTGQATGTVVVSSLALGLVEGNAVGTAVGTITLGGVAVGQRSTTGQATGTLTVVGLATGVKTVRGVAAGQIALTGLAVGVRTVRGVTTGTITLTGLAAGAGAAVAFEIVGEWNDQTINAMQWGAQPVVEWFMLETV